MGPIYKIQIVHADGTTIATFHGKGQVERDLVQGITDAVLRKGTWWVRRSKLEAAVTAAINEVLYDLKLEATQKHLA